MARAAPPKATCGSREILNQCAWAAARTRDTYLSAQFWRLARRIGKKKAAVAVGHSILVICWHLLANDADYDDLGGDYFTRRNDPDRHRDRLIEQLHTSAPPSARPRGRPRPAATVRPRRTRTPSSPGR